MARRYNTAGTKPTQNKQEKGPSDKKTGGPKKDTRKEEEAEGK